MLSQTGDEISTPVRTSASGSSLPHASPADSAKRTAQTPSGFAATAVPRFFKPGEGGRGKGKPLEGQHLDQKLVSAFHLCLYTARAIARCFIAGRHS